MGWLFTTHKDRLLHVNLAPATTSSQVGSKVLGCVVCRFRVAASKQSLDKVPYINCPKLSQTSKHHLQSLLSLLSWTINLGFLTEGKLASIFIKTFSWGFPTGRSFTTSQQVFWHHHHRAITSFLASLPGRRLEDFCEGSFRTHILYFVIVLLYFIYFSCIILYQKPKKIRILGSCCFFTFSSSC
jgi:hypothetical protein